MTASTSLAGPGARIVLNGRTVTIEWSQAADAALARRTTPLTLELGLFFSCLIKKVVEFHETPPARETIAVNDKLRLFFTAFTAVACSLDQADRLGGQPRMELDTPVVRKLAPSRVWIDHRRGAWVGEFSI